MAKYKKKKIKRLKEKLRKLKHKELDVEAMLIEALEKWDEYIHPFETEYNKIAKKVKKTRKKLARLRKTKKKHLPSAHSENNNIPSSSKIMDNLKKIEGIGPKIEDLLNVEGIFSFRDLARTSAQRLKSILLEAGSRFRMYQAISLSWPQQARLAAKGDWSGLKKLQKELKNTKK